MCVTASHAHHMWRLSRRGLAAASSKGRGKKNSVLDLGWEKLTAPLEATDLQLPALKTLRVLHPKIGTGHAGARKFKALLPALRWQNPEASIDMRWDEAAPASRVAIELPTAARASSTSPVSALRQFWVRCYVPQEQMMIDRPSVEWAAEFLKDGRCLQSRTSWREPPDAPVQPEDDYDERLLPDDDDFTDAREDEYGAPRELAQGNTER